MLRFVRLILLVWFLSSVFVVISMHSGETHPCDIPIVRSLGRQIYEEHITDYRTGIELSQDFNYHLADMSHDESYRFVISNLGDAATEIYLSSIQDGNQTLLYSTRFDVAVHWSVDGSSLFIYEYRMVYESQQAQRLIGIDIVSGEIWFEYVFSSPIGSGLMSRSPDNHYFYIRDLAGRASVDTQSGEITFFNQLFPQDYQLWSLDRAWLIRGSMQQFHVTDPKTGELHPYLNQAIDGRYPQWTNNSIWFTRSENGIYSVWRASLLDGRIEREHFNMNLRYVSPDDRWRIVAPPDDETESISYIYDSDTDTMYQENDVSWVDFSDNGRCMLVVKLISINPRLSELMVYDLATMTRMYRSNLGIVRTFRFFFSYQWYDDHYVDSVDGLYTLLD